MTESKQHLIGVDCGELVDPTAIAAAEIEPGAAGYLVRVGYLQTLPLRSPFQQVAARIGEIEASLRERGPVTVLIDSTGMGQAVPELVRERVDCRVISCRLTGGEEPRYSGNYWKVPKAAMVNELIMLTDQNRLRLPGRYPTAETAWAVEEALGEMRDFQANQRKASAGRVVFEGRQGRHDDIITALGLACWGAKEWMPIPTPSIIF